MHVAGKRRRKDGGFIGSDEILKELKAKPAMRRIGLISTGPVARSEWSLCLFKCVVCAICVHSCVYAAGLV